MGIQLSEFCYENVEEKNYDDKKTFKLVHGSIMIDGYYIQYFRTNDSDPDPYSVALWKDSRIRICMEPIWIPDPVMLNVDLLHLGHQNPKTPASKKLRYLVKISIRNLL